MLTRTGGHLVTLVAVAAVTAVVLTTVMASRPATAQGYFADPFVQLTSTNTRPELGAEVRFDLTVGNDGGYSAYDVQAKLQLPIGFRINVVFPPQWSRFPNDGTRMWCDVLAGDVVTCEVPKSVLGTPLTAQVFAFAPSATGSSIARAEIAQSDEDANLSNSVATLGLRVVPVTASLFALQKERIGVVQRNSLVVADGAAGAVRLRPDLYVRAMANGVPLETSRSGRGRTTVGFFIGNEGSVDATAVTLVATLPGGFTVGQIGQPSGFNCTPSAAGAGTQVKCVGDMRSGSWSEISLPLAHVTAPHGSYQVQAVVDPGNTIAESDEADNRAAVAINVVK